MFLVHMLRELFLDIHLEFALESWYFILKVFKSIIKNKFPWAQNYSSYDTTLLAAIRWGYCSLDVLRRYSTRN